MRIYKRHSALTYFPDAKKPSISPNLSYNYSLNRECIDLKYVPTVLDYPTTIDYYISVEVVKLPESNKTYYLNSVVKVVHLPSGAKENDCVILVNRSGWGINLFSTCTSLHIGAESFTYLELRYCGDSWKLVKKGTISHVPASRLMYVASAKSTSLIDELYKPYVFGYGYVNFADIYELYSIGLPNLIDEVERYQNNTLIFSGTPEVAGPVQSYATAYTPSLEFPLFQVWEVSANGTTVSDQIPDQLKLKFSTHLVQAMPAVSAMLRNVNIKFENTATSTIDPVYTLDPTDTLVEVENVTTSEVQTRDVDYVVSNSHILPTLRGGIFHNDNLLVKFWRDYFIS